MSAAQGERDRIIAWLRSKADENFDPKHMLGEYTASLADELQAQPVAADPLADTALEMYQALKAMTAYWVDSNSARGEAILRQAREALRKAEGR